METDDFDEVQHMLPYLMLVKGKGTKLNEGKLCMRVLLFMT